MKKFTVLLVLIAGMFTFNACQKEENLAPSSAANPTPQKMTDLVIKSSFDWKTTKTYQFTFAGNATDNLSIASISGAVYHKALLTAKTAYKITLVLPSFETKLRFLYNGAEVEYSLNSTTVNYTFK